MGLHGGGSVGILIYQSHYFYAFENLLPLGSLGFEHFQILLEIPGELCISFSCSSSPRSVHILAGHVTGQFRLQTLAAVCWMGSFLVSTTVSMLQDITHWCPIINCWVLKGLPLRHLTLWQLINMFCTDKGSLPQFAWQLQLSPKHLQQRFMSSIGKNGQVHVVKRVTKQCHICP